MNAELHEFTDQRGRNLCDRCDNWSGSPSHLPVAEAQSVIEQVTEMDRSGEYLRLVEILAHWYGGDSPSEKAYRRAINEVDAAIDAERVPA